MKELGVLFIVEQSWVQVSILVKQVCTIKKWNVHRERVYEQWYVEDECNDYY